MSLNHISTCLSGLGCREDALKAIEEAVQLWRQLAADCPAAFAPDLSMSLNNLSMSLNNLSICLSDLGHQEDALKTIKGAVQLQRQLAADCPTAFTPDLVISLNNLSTCLSGLGH